MRFLPIRPALLFMCAVFLTAALLFSLTGRPAEPAAAPLPLADAQELTLELAGAEKLLLSRRAELSDLLQEYYRGQAGETETAQLIAEVEELRQSVENLRRQLSELAGPSED